MGSVRTSVIEESKQAAEQVAMATAKLSGLDTVQFCIAIGLSIFGGLAKFLHVLAGDRAAGLPAKALAFVLFVKLTLAFFTGIMTVYGLEALAISMNSPALLVWAKMLAGMAGWLGPAAIDLYADAFDGFVRRLFKLEEREKK